MHYGLHQEAQPPNRMTDTCENITFPQPRLRVVKFRFRNDL